MNNTKKILILGVTASGKGTLGFELARYLHGEIISVDSMKVYRRMDIGTAKPSGEKQKLIPYHLIDVIEPSDSFSVDQFLDLTDRAVNNIQDLQKPVIATGGTAMYIKALLYGLFNGPGSNLSIREKLKEAISKEGLLSLYKRLSQIDPDASERIHPNDEKRIIRALEVYEITGKPISSFQNQWSVPNKTEWFVIGLRREKELENHRINMRVKKMVEQGLLDEVRSLLSESKPMSQQAAAAIGYAETIEHLNGKCNFEDAVEQIKINTRKFAKSQRTWFKTFRDVNWIDLDENDTVESVLEKTLAII